MNAIAQILPLDDIAWCKPPLVECVQEYSPLRELQKVKLLSILDEPQRGLETMIRTLTQQAIDEALTLVENVRKEVFEIGRKIGMEQALNWGRNILLTLLRERFPRLTAATEQQISAMSKEELDTLAPKILKAKSLRELGLNE